MCSDVTVHVVVVLVDRCKRQHVRDVFSIHSHIDVPNAQMIVQVAFDEHIFLVPSLQLVMIFIWSTFCTFTFCSFSAYLLLIAGPSSSDQCLKFGDLNHFTFLQFKGVRRSLSFSRKESLESANPQ